MAAYAGGATSLGVYSPSVENACRNDDGLEMSTMDNEILELLSLPPHTNPQTSWHSSSWKEYSTEEFFQLDGQNSVNNSSLNMISLSHHCLYAHSAFTAYTKADPKAALNLSTAAQILHKRCFRLLTKIERIRKLEREMSILKAPPPAAAAAAADNDFQDRQVNTGFQNKSAFEHMLAERSRRDKLKQHFSNIYSLLPRKSKKDKNSILENTASYLRELKSRVADLEQRNQSLKELNHTNISNTDEGSSGFDSHHQRFDSERTVLYRSDEVALERCKDIPCQVNIRINVLQTDVISCPATVLMKILEKLRAEKLEVLSMESHTDVFWFHANILVGPKCEEWNTSKWQNFGGFVTDCFVANRDNPNHIWVG